MAKEGPTKLILKTPKPPEKKDTGDLGNPKGPTCGSKGGG